LKPSEEFEREVFRIHELLQGPGAKVEWDDRIPDPDNPEQPRQIDITVRKDGVLTLIECRKTLARQNVKWIEELIGRKQSLHADTIIAVSSAGFTKGALRKACSYGIHLHKLQEITADEIALWAGHVTLTLYYYQYSDLAFSLCFDSMSLRRLSLQVVEEQLRPHPLVQHGFNSAAQQLGKVNLLAETGEKSVRFGIRCGLSDVFLAGEPVREIALEGAACLSRMPILLPKKSLYEKLTRASIHSTVISERGFSGETSAVREGGRIAVDIDLSAISLPPLSQIRFIRIESEEELAYESFAITNPQDIRVRGKLNVSLFGI
jgi:hypothetical protein